MLTLTSMRSLCVLIHNYIQFACERSVLICHAFTRIDHLLSHTNYIQSSEHDYTKWKFYWKVLLSLTFGAGLCRFRFHDIVCINDSKLILNLFVSIYRYENKQPQLFRNQMSFQNKQPKSEIFKQAYLDANGWDNLSTSICKIPVHQQQCMLLIRNQKTIPACLSWHNLGDLNLLPTPTKAFQQFSAFVFNALLSVPPGSIHAPTNEDAIFNRKRGDCGTNREITYATEWFMFAIFSSSIAQTLLFPRRRRFQKQFASFMLREQTNIGGEKIV